MSFFKSIPWKEKLILMNKSMKNYRRHLLSLASTLLACLLFLSACGSNITGETSTARSGSPTAIPSPTLSPLLQKQGAVELESFQQWITLMQQYGGNVSTYQQQYTGDQQALNSATSDAAYQAVLKRLQGHVSVIKLPAMKTEATALQQQLQQGATQWSQQHTYYDDFNQTTYNLGYEYGVDGISSWAQQQIDNSQTLADYQQTIENLHMWLSNFQAYKADFVDKTPYNQVHQTDTQWRTEYGPNKQFPHIDVNGTPFAYEGSHGCVNMSTSDVQWVYNFASTLSTKIVIY